MSKRCILCLSQLSARESPEHVILNAFGGRLTTRVATCTTCNHTTNEIADSKFAQDYVFWRNYLGIASGDGDPPPTLRGLRTPTGEHYNLAPGGQPERWGLKFKRDSQDPGRARVEGAANQIASQIPNFAKAIGIPPERFAEGIQDGWAEVVTAVKSTKLQQALFELSHFRSVTKSALILWALEHGNEELCSERFNAARRFALGGDAAECLLVAIDCRPTPAEPPQALERGPFDHWLTVWSELDGSVYCHMTVFGHFGYALRIGGSSVASRAAMLWMNPISETPSWWKGEIEVPQAWRFDSNLDVESVRQAIINF
jgi:hypothetical protein